MREIVWAVSNITAGHDNHCLSVVNSNIFEIIIGYFTDNDYKLRKEALFTVNNCSSSSLELTIKMISLGLFQKLCQVLESEKNEDIILLSLDTIANLISTGECLLDISPYYSNTVAKKFDECGGVTLVESIQNHSNEKIHNFSVKILTKYFPTQEIINN